MKPAVTMGMGRRQRAAPTQHKGPAGLEKTREGGCWRQVMGDSGVPALNPGAVPPAWVTCPGDSVGITSPLGLL